MFLSLEFSQLGRGDDGKHFKSAFYRAIQVRPGSKRLYLDAARYDREALHEVEWNTIGSANTRQASDIFQEKELRLRTILEEMEL